MDTKLTKMAEKKYRIAECCTTCLYSSLDPAPGTNRYWGSCSINTYNDGTEKNLPAHFGLVCSSYKKLVVDPSTGEYVYNLGTYAKEPWKGSCDD